MKAVMNELEKMMISFFSLMKFILLLDRWSKVNWMHPICLKPALARRNQCIGQQH
jgi:hypothetical protein